MATLTIDDETAALLRVQAEARGVALEVHVRELAERDGERLKPARPTLSREEFAHVLRELAAGTEHVPPLPETFSRADIYFDDRH